MKTAPALFAAALLAGCARDDNAYPSLAPRAVEGRGFGEPAVAPPTPAVPDPALDRRVAAWAERLDAIVDGYDGDAARAKGSVAAKGAGTVGSEAWIGAQTALAALDDWRAQASGLATELDDAARERATSVGAPYPALDALRQRVDAEAEREGAGIAALNARVPTP